MLAVAPVVVAQGDYPNRPIRLVVPSGARPFWDLLRQKVALLPS